MRKIWMVLGATVVALLVAAGFIHVVHGGESGTSLCAKSSWALGGTLVDVTDFVDQPESVTATKRDVMIAIERCEIVRIPKLERERFEIFVTKTLADLKIKPVRIEARDSGSMIAVIADSAECERLEPAIRSYTRTVPDGLGMLCDTNLRVVWLLRARDGALR